jgi:branched-chain amino acid transport system ATP-binding protein
MSDGATLELRDLEVRYGRVPALSGVSLTVPPASIFALVGMNGAGKSTLIKAVMGLAATSAGAIRFGDLALVGKSTADIVRAGIAYSPEGRRVFAAMTVQENLRLGAYTLPSDQFAARLARILGYFPRLGERAHQSAGSLSGGEQQMLAIGRALMSNPKVLLLDEPSLGLAPIVVQSIGALIRQIRDQEGIMTILAEQNVRWALGLASHAAVLELGRITAAGSAQALRDDPDFIRSYMGA